MKRRIGKIFLLCIVISMCCLMPPCGDFGSGGGSNASIYCEFDGCHNKKAEQIFASIIPRC